MLKTIFHVPIVLACFAVVAGGCGKAPPPYGTVHGRVTLDGEPVGAGSIVFYHAEAGIARMANLGPNGEFVVHSYDLGGLPVGHYQVSISPHRVSAGNTTPIQPPTGPTSEVIIPVRYREPDTSGLSAEVREGENSPFHFDLEP